MDQPNRPLTGLLNLNKPAGVTSRRVVDLALRLAGRTKAGHAGTLDPLASGVLVVCLGAATRLIEHVQQMPKQYAATFLLGRESPTEDVDGPVTELANPPVPRPEQIAAAAAALTGRILQRPPAFSALKVEGRRAYDLARKGESVALAARPVTIYRIDVECYAYPELRLRVECGSGTYVRSLGRDLAASLGTAAVMSRLVRTAIGEFRAEDAADPASLTRETFRDHLLPPLRAVERLPRIVVAPDEIARLRAGQTIRRPDAPPAQGPVAAIDSSGALVALLRLRGPATLGPEINL